MRRRDSPPRPEASEHQSHSEERKVKVLDFGLAKALQEPAETDQSTTISMATTRADAIVGTPAYMSPEQAAGQPVDKRTDIWSFGCVLYEMLAGRRAFGGQTIIETLSAVAKAEPEWTRLPPTAPNTVRQVLNLCLKKEPSQRLHHIVDARILIEHAEIPSGISTTRRAPRRPDPRGCDRARGVDHVVLPGPPPRSEQPQVARPLTHPAIDLTANAQLALGIQVPLTGFDSPVVALSRDGRYLAYVGQSPSGTMLYLREIGALTVPPVTGTEGAIYAFFSPDTRWLGFLRRRQVKKVPATQGRARASCRCAPAVRASWTLGGAIYFIDFRRPFLVARARRRPTVAAAAPPATPGHPRGGKAVSATVLPKILPGGRAAVLSEMDPERPRRTTRDRAPVPRRRRIPQVLDPGGYVPEYASRRIM